MTIWKNTFGKMPLIGIMRGVIPAHAIEVVTPIIEAGFRVVEVPLNSPDAYDSIDRLTKHFPDNILIGAGTVLTEDDVQQVHDAGGRLVVAPNLDECVAQKCQQLGLIYCPGVQTATEAFKGIVAGATALKLFPAELIPSKGLKALKTVLPKNIQLIPVGGINPSNMAEYKSAGASGFGLGSALYQPGKSVKDIAKDAARFVDALNKMQL
jgi:2-dehydro-3-deoxyphosphogalactonate aldolase